MSKKAPVVEFDGAGSALGKKERTPPNKELQEDAGVSAQAYREQVRPSYIKAKTEEVGETVLKAPGELATRLRYLKDLKENIEEGLTEINKDIDECSKALAELMESLGLDGLKVPEGTVYIEQKNRPRIVNQPEFYAYLRATPGGESLIKETVHPKTLESWVNEELANARALPASISNFVQKRAVIRRK